MNIVRSWSLTIFLLRSDRTEEVSFLGEDISKLTKVTIALPDDPGRTVMATLYFQARRPAPPKWAAFFGDHLEGVTLPPVASAPALLIAPIDDRLLAVTFSHGSALLDPGAIDATFGLRATLNSVDPKKVRSYDKKTFDALFRQTREQAANETRLENFGIDAERDLVRKVSGKPSDVNLGSSMTGGSSVRIQARVGPHNLVPYLRTLFNKSRLNSYLDDYPWLGRIQEERDPEILEILESELDDAMRSYNPNISLSVPEIVDWSDAAGFRFVLPQYSNQIYPELSLESLRSALSDKQLDFDLETLRRQKAEMVNDEHIAIKQWRLYDCLNAELSSGKESYVLSSGAWYSVDSEMLAKIDTEIEEIPDGSWVLPELEFDDQTELDYNKRCAALLADHLCCIDSQLITFDRHSKFELADLVDREGNLLHVKRHGGSSVLSHLFAQGLVSTELLMTYTDFRQEADRLISGVGFALSPGRTFREKQPRDVTYVIVGGSANSRPRLPAFSRINLRNAMRRIRAFGWKTRLQFIAESHTRSKSTIVKKRRRRP